MKRARCVCVFCAFVARWIAGEEGRGVTVCLRMWIHLSGGAEDGELARRGKGRRRRRGMGTSSQAAFEK